MSTHIDILKLEKNSKEQYNIVSRLLVKIADNVLKNPSNQKVRTLQKTNANISEKILGVKGGLECLKLMGFEDNTTSLTLPMDAPLNKLERVKVEIVKRQEAASFSENVSNTEKVNKQTIPGSSVNHVYNKKDNPENIEQENIKQVILPPFSSTIRNPFLYEIASHFHNAQVHDNKALQARAKKLIPIDSLEALAQKRLRMVQEKQKKEKLVDPELSIQDMLILELLSWFKNSFFSWVDNPECNYCGGQTKFSHMSSDPEILVYTTRVEMHKCVDCNILTPFPRYNDLNILMETRKGRCGEWANTFTLFCRSMGWDARHVFDQTDHVWTEVYSFAQKRWLHCDSCENACDTPLIYESGWNKEVSYVIAYSGEEVQDVTWRYTSNHGEVLKRRNKCTEIELVSLIVALRKERQKSLSESRRKYLAKRILEELVDLMVERKPSDDDQQGRASGSVAWRLSRGELQQSSESTSHVWTFSDSDAVENSVTVRYSVSFDKYEQLIGSKIKHIRECWSNGINEANGIFRKEEKDWKMVYLCRQENVSEGKIVWKFNVQGTKVFDIIQVYFNYNLYENGIVNIDISGESKSVCFSHGYQSLKTDVLSGSRTITITAVLKGGKGNLAWQHTQLFRQALNCTEYPFTVIMSFRDRN